MAIYNDAGELNLFGYTISKKPKEIESKSFVPKQDINGGTEVIVNSGAAFNSYSIDLDPSAIKHESDLITKYREISLISDIDLAISEINDEFLVINENEPLIEIDFTEEFAEKYSDKTKKLITEEFTAVLKLLKFNQIGTDIVRNWYIDGRLAYHKIIDQNNQKDGIKELRPIDVARLKRIVEIIKEKDQKTNVSVVKGQNDYYVYAEVQNQHDNKTGIKIAPESIAYVTSGLVDRTTGVTISYLHKAIRPMNQLRMMEDSDVIYRLTRAPERRVFYIDTQGMARTKAEQYIKDVMARYKNKQVYNAQTGTVVDSTKHMSILEDFFLPRNTNGKGTEITTLPSGGCLSMDTKVKLLDGRDLSISEIEKEMNAGKVLWTYSCHPTTGAIVPGIITWAGVTQKSAKVMKLTFDNGEELVCTPDHKFPLYDRGFVEAKDLQINESMIPIYTKNEFLGEYKKADYTKVFNNETKKWIPTHRLVAEFFRNELVNEFVFNPEYVDNLKFVVHHKNFNRYDNSPENLCFMSWEDHAAYHRANGFSIEASILGAKSVAANRKYLKENKLEEYKLFLEKCTQWLYNCSDEEYDEYCRKVSIGIIRHITNLSPEERIARNQRSIDNFKKGSEVFARHLKSDSEFYVQYCQSLKDSWTDERRVEASVRTTKMNYAMWETEEHRKKYRAKQKSEINEAILKRIIDLAKGKTTHQLTLHQITDMLNSDEAMIAEYVKVNNSKTSRFDKTKFTAGLLKNTVKDFGYKGWHDFRKTCALQNHRLIKIEYLDAPIEVGTLTIDGDEKFHNYHTFALTCGIFTKNSLGSIENTTYFQQKLWASLNLPLSRMQTGQGSFNIGRSNEITRDEIKFAKFISKLRMRFNLLFIDLLKTQLLLKGITTLEDWNIIKDSIVFKYSKDNFFAELKESDILRERLQNVAQADVYVGKYFSQRHVMREILKMTDEECDRMEEQMSKEAPPPEAVPPAQ